MSRVAVVREEGLARLPFRPEDEEVARRFTALLRQALKLLDWGPRCRGRSVLIKPNLVRTFPGRPGNTTDPRVILGLLRALQEHRPARLLVGENPGCGVTSVKAFAESGCGRVARLAGAELRPFDREPLAEVEVPGGVLLRRARVPRVWLEADLVINLPAMKTHLHAGVSLGIKNLHGLLVDEDRYFFHRMDVHQKMVDLLKIRPPDLTVIDGVLVDGTAAATRGSATVSGWFDRYVVDGLVNLQAWIVQNVSAVLRKVQTGVTQNYALAIVLGIVILSFVYIFR